MINKNKIFSYSPVLILLSLNLIIFILQLLFLSNINSYFIGISAISFEMPWTFFTHMFFHSGIMHIMFNMIGLFFFGSFVEQLIGAKRFYLVYFGAGIIAGIITTISYIVFGSSGVGIGASGALMGIVGCTIILRPNVKVMIIPVPIPMSLWVVGIIYFLIDSLGFILNFFVNTNIGHLTHIIGMAIGILFGYYFKKNKYKNKYKVSKEETIIVQDAQDYMKNKKW